MIAHRIKESFAELSFWFSSRLSEFQKRSLLVVNKAFEILSNEELDQKVGFSEDSKSYSISDMPPKFLKAIKNTEF
ncbi:MAG: hypothetical protein AAF620_12845 [Bacteroidota bacterium]